MRSIPFSITWEMLYRGRLTLIAAALGSNFLPFFLESALMHQGGIDPADSSQIIMHVVLVQFNLFLFGFAVIAAQGNPARLFTAPVRTSTLVTWHLVPGMVLVFLHSALSTYALNSMFHLNWPIWGPALFAAVSLIAVNAALWQTEKTAWIFLALCTVAGVLGLWYKGRHGSTFGQPVHYWEHVTFSEFCTLLLAAAVSYYAAVQGVARSRRGDTLKSLGIVDWFTRAFDPAPDIGSPFRTPEAAQFWFVWRQKGWAMPVCVVFGALIGGLISPFSVRSFQDFFEGLAAGGSMLPVVGFLGGMIIGNCGASDSSFEIGNFLGTRPMTSRRMAQIIIQTAVRSVLSAWGIWAVITAIALVVAWYFRVSTMLNMPDGFWWAFFPGTMLGTWVITGMGATLCITGRSIVFAGTIIASLVLWFGGIIISEYTLSAESRVLLWQGVVAGLGVLFVLVTIWAYLKARQQSLIEGATLYKALLAWLILSVPVICAVNLSPQPPWTLLVLGVGLMALVVAPISTIPLALAWNRVR